MCAFGISSESILSDYTEYGRRQMRSRPPSFQIHLKKTLATIFLWLGILLCNCHLHPTCYTPINTSKIGHIQCANHPQFGHIRTICTPKLIGVLCVRIGVATKNGKRLILLMYTYYGDQIIICVYIGAFIYI